MVKNGTNPLTYFGKVSNMSFRQRKKAAIKAVFANSTLELPEQNLAFGVVSTAINDIREVEETALILKRRAMRNVNIPNANVIVKNSIQAWYDGDLIPWLNVLNIEWDYVRGIFKHFKLMPKDLRPLWIIMVKNERRNNGTNKISK